MINRSNQKQGKEHTKLDDSWASLRVKDVLLVIFLPAKSMNTSHVKVINLGLQSSAKKETYLHREGTGKRQVDIPIQHQALQVNVQPIHWTLPDCVVLTVSIKALLAEGVTTTDIDDGFIENVVTQSTEQV